MAKKSKEIISELSIQRAIKITLLFFLKYKQWKKFAYFRNLQKVKDYSRELSEKGFLIQRGRWFALTEKGLRVTELFEKSRSGLEIIFHSYIWPERTKSKKEE